MGVVNTKSTNVSNADSTPVKRTKALLAGGRLRSIVAQVEVASGDDDTSVYRIARVWSGWSIRSIKKFTDAITSGTSYDFGLYETAENGGAVVDADAYASGVDLSSADVAGGEVAYEARNIDNMGEQVWQDAGKTADTKRWYDLCLLANTVGSANGTIAVEIQYVDGS